MNWRAVEQTTGNTHWERERERARELASGGGCGNVESDYKAISVGVWQVIDGAVIHSEACWRRRCHVTAEMTVIRAEHHIHWSQSHTSPPQSLQLPAQSGPTALSHPARHRFLFLVKSGEKSWGCFFFLLWFHRLPKKCACIILKSQCHCRWNRNCCSKLLPQKHNTKQVVAMWLCCSAADERVHSRVSFS